MPSSNRNNRRKRKKQKDTRVLMLAVLAAILALFVLIMPKIPVPKAVNVSASGHMSTHAGLILSEVMTDNVSALPDENGKFGDWVEIYNSLDEPMDLTGVGLSDRSDRIKFLFPAVTLSAHGRVIVFCDKVNKDDPHGAFHAKFGLSSLKDAVYLFDASGVSIDVVNIPTLNADESYIRLENGAWEKTDDYSPGFPNTFEGHDTYIAQYTVEPDVLMINEVVPTPRSGLRDEDDELSDWVELYNAGDKNINLKNFALSDDETKPLKWTFPEDAVIPANGYYIVFCSGKNKIEESTRYPHTNFGINNEEETLVLSTITGELIDRVTVSNVGRDMSYGRDPETRSWRIYTLPTPGAPNNQTGANRADQYLRAINTTGVYISEIMSSSNVVKAFPDFNPSDFIEIYNSSAQTWDLSGWGLSDNINWPRKWTFPQGTSISPGEYKVILCDKFMGANTNVARLRASFGLKRAGSEMITLADATGRVIDRLFMPEIPTDISYGRTLGSNGFFYYDAPTPGAANGSGFYGFTSKPTLSAPSGLYTGYLILTMDCPDPSATIRYTVDGSIPTIDNSFVYTPGQELRVEENNAVLRVRAFQYGLQPSETVTATYIMNTYHSLDVVSLVCEPNELWNTVNGLMSDAPDLEKTPDGVVNKSKLPFKTPLYRTYGKDDRPGFVEIFSQNTKRAYISQGIKMDLMGDYSLDMPQKSFKVRAQAAYGEKYFNYPLFDHRDYTYYKSFTLRNSGNDNVWTRVADGVQTRLIDKYLNSPVLTLDWKPVVVYLNGEYWGHYNMRERKDRFSIAQHEGLDLEKDKDIYENMTILRAGWSPVQGSNSEYRAMLKKIADLKPNSKAEDLQYIYDHIDVDSYIDWYAIKMFFGDSDPGNIMFYKLPGGKWKCLMFDLDYGLFNSQFNSPKSYLKTSGMGQQNINNTIFRKMIESNEIRDQFLTRLGVIYQTLTSEVMIDMLDQCTAAIYPELPRHYARWAPYKEPTINSESPTTSDGYMRYWQQRVNRMKNTMNKRPYYLWGYVQEQFGLSNSQMIYYFGERPPQPAD